MSTPEERLQNAAKADFIIKKAAGDNESAQEYLRLLSVCSRIVDDIYDEFETVTRKDLLELVENLFIKIPANSFYQQHQGALFSQHITMWNAWEISNFLDEGNETDKIYAHVLRDYIIEILPLVALLTQGQYKMKEVNLAIRLLFNKKLGE